jgi:hypothetical protein
MGSALEVTFTTSITVATIQKILEYIMEVQYMVVVIDGTFGRQTALECTLLDGGDMDGLTISMVPEAAEVREIVAEAGTAVEIGEDT